MLTYPTSIRSRDRYNRGHQDGYLDVLVSHDDGAPERPRLNRAPDALRLDADYRTGYADGAAEAIR